MEAAGWANMIASLALIVSLVAAFFSWRSSAEAKVTNRISSHLYQRELFEAFLSLVRHLNSKRKYVDRDIVAEFDAHSRSAELYVSKSTAKQIEGFYAGCIGIIDLEESLSSYRALIIKAKREASEYTLEDVEVMERVVEAKSAFEGASKALDDKIENTLALGNQLSEVMIAELKIR